MGKPVREISSVINKPRSTLQDVIQQFNTRKIIKTPRSGRPRCLSDGNKRCLIKRAKKDPKTSAPRITAKLLRNGVQVSESTGTNVCKAARYHGHVARK